MVNYNFCIYFSEEEKYCELCRKFIKSRLWASHLRTNIHKNHGTITKRKGVEIVKSAFQERIISYRILADGFFINIQKFLDTILPQVISLIEEELQKHTCVKVNLELFGLYLNPTTEAKEIKSFNTTFRIFCSDLDEKILQEMFKVIDQKSEEFAEKDSGMYINIFFYIIDIKLFFFFFQVGFYFKFYI